MANPFHDADGKFASRDEMVGAINRLIATNEIDKAISLLEDLKTFDAETLKAEDDAKKGFAQEIDIKTIAKDYIAKGYNVVAMTSQSDHPDEIAGIPVVGPEAFSKKPNRKAAVDPREVDSVMNKQFTTIPEPLTKRPAVPAPLTKKPSRSKSLLSDVGAKMDRQLQDIKNSNTEPITSRSRRKEQDIVRRGMQAPSKPVPNEVYENFVWKDASSFRELLKDTNGISQDYYEEPSFKRENLELIESRLDKTWAEGHTAGYDAEMGQDFIRPSSHARERCLETLSGMGIDVKNVDPRTVKVFEAEFEKKWEDGYSEGARDA